MFIVSSLFFFSTSPDGRSNTVRKYRKEKKREREGVEDKQMAFIMTQLEVCFFYREKD